MKAHGVFRLEPPADAREEHGKGVVSPFKKSVGDPGKGTLVMKLAHCLYTC